MKYEEIKIIDFTDTCHMSFEGYHTSERKGIFDCPGLTIHNKKVMCHTVTEKSKKTGNFLKGRNIWYLESPSEKHFKTIKDLVWHYCANELDISNEAAV